MKKSITLFVVVMILSTSFNLSLIAEDVKASSVCCQKTKTGDYCQFTSEAECDPGFRTAPALCENTNLCQLGCCVDDFSGVCFANSPLSLCESKGGSFTTDSTCSIAQCAKGACVIGNECSFTTQAACKAAAAKFENVGFKFDASVTNEVDAINLCRSSERGCCVAEDSCSYLTKEECSSGNFASGKYCSDSSLTCNCAGNSYKSCIPGDEDVYWFDSCGNPEEKAQECDYASGTVCGEVESGDVKCISTACVDSYQSQASPDSGQTRKSGESWCVYDAAVGFGTDVVGSRHYRAICMNGEEIFEPCEDYRKEICVSNDIDFDSDTSLPFNPGSGTFTEAVCRPNRWEDCTSIDNQEDCQDTEDRDCFWQGYRCVPHVPPGFRFWEDEGSDVCSQGNQECTVLLRRPGIGLFSGSGVREWKCEANCECEDREWRVGANNYCVALGDCGAYYNIAGKASMDGFSSTHDQISPSDLGDWDEISSGSQLDPEKQGTWQQIWSEAKSGLIVAGITAFYVGLTTGRVPFAGPTKGLWKEGFFSGLKGITSIANPGKMAQVGAKNYLPKSGIDLVGKTIPKGQTFACPACDPSSTLSGGVKVLDAQKGLYEVVDSNGITGQTGMTSAASPTAQGWATAAQWLNTIMWIYTIYTVLDVLLADTKEITYTVTCSPWQAPSGGDNCELCNTRGIYNDKEIKPCTEYACSSLGAGCKLLNEGTSNQTCAFVSPKDSSSPRLSPYTSLLTKGYTVSTLDNGYRINEEVAAFEDLTFGVKTNEPAQCKVSDKLGTTFPDMTSFLGNNLYGYDHYASVKIPQEVLDENKVEINNGGQYSFYVRCQDGNGNDNDVDYLIQFNVKKGPDLTPPSIDQTSIPNGGYVKNGIKAANISFFANEPAECRWASTETGFESMQNKMSCATSGLNPSPNNLYECTTILTDIKDNAVNKFFVKCKDTSENVMQQSYEYTLQGTVPLKIVEKSPNGGKTAKPILKVKTADGATKDGAAICGFGLKDDKNSMAQFFTTGTSEHSQVLTLPDGTHKMNILCIDEAGNEARESLTFTSFTDKKSPIITRIYEDRSLSRSVLHITTDESSICEYYSKSFIFGQGTRMPVDDTSEHEAPYGNPVYYVVCADASNNTSPLTMIFP